MIFSSAIFMVWFLPIFLAGWYLMDARFKNTFLLIASALFYAWGGPVFIFAILLVSTVDFFLVRWMAAEEDARKRKRKLLLPILLNLGMLAWFKYANFFAWNIQSVLRSLGIDAGEWQEIALPLGISFYTFETITYVVDVYRRNQAPLPRLRDYQLYILFFPKLLVGPIVRCSEFAPQIYNRSETAELRLAGFYRIITGLGKKLLIANSLAYAVQASFTADLESLSSTAAWLGMVAYLLQVYFDFSGYTDIALGIALILGFRLPENFDNPLTSRSFTEFWSRWHITFGNFMRNYLYIPLGGNRKGKWRTGLNLWVVFLVSGLWHGASWNCVLWGAYQGFFITLERVFLGRLLRKLPGALSVFYTFSFFGISIVLFWPDTFSHALEYYQAMFRFSPGLFPAQFDREFWFSLGIALLFAFWALAPGLRKIQDRWFSTTRSAASHYRMALITALLFWLCLSYAVWSPFNPFVYMRF